MHIRLRIFSYICRIPHSTAIQQNMKKLDSIYSPNLNFSIAEGKEPINPDDSPRRKRRPKQTWSSFWTPIPNAVRTPQQSPRASPRNSPGRSRRGTTSPNFSSNRKIDSFLFGGPPRRSPHHSRPSSFHEDIPLKLHSSQSNLRQTRI